MAPEMKEIPVYLFTGFLDSGKTTFIQSVFDTPDDSMDKKTLLLVCEEGDIEYDPLKFASQNIHIEVIENEKDLNQNLLASIAARHNIDDVMIEYNASIAFQGDAS